RHDYENIDAHNALALIQTLRAKLPALTGQRFSGFHIKAADDFAYIDPVDGSTAEQQGIRILSTDGSRIILRLSGTGTQGATLRIYMERFVEDTSQHHRDVQEMVAPLVAVVENIADIRRHTGRARPTVIT
ncbi:MAG: alpha-D-glucose phosphate-specific phosphoglucomutase, partial [Gammaproteobacteria bacterium]|nr:alpha-D-glucose phosphate-specific phosphoglucomutase [Gammaproteobacteria bacterium]